MWSVREEFCHARITGATQGHAWINYMLQLGRFLRHCIVQFKLSLAHGNINHSQDALQCSPDPERMLEETSTPFWVQV